MYELESYQSMNNSVSNPFGAIQQPTSIGTAQAVSHELAEMQAQIYLAKQFPRDQRRATEQILTACQRPGLAAVAVYTYARGGSSISGPSIRLAEEIARSWGNLECGWNEVERVDDTSKLRTFAWDKETNVLKTLYFYVPHYRTTKQGRKRITDERDLYELLANQASRRMRNCILALIPGDVVDAAVEQCERTMLTKCDITPESIKNLVGAFATFGVTKEQIEKRIQRKLDAITPAQFVKMREIYSSLKDGMSDPEDWFDSSDEEKTVETKEALSKATAATESLKDALKIGNSTKRGRPKKQVQTSENEPAQDADVDSCDGTTSNNVEKMVDSFDGFRELIFSANSVEELKKAADDITACVELKDVERDTLYHFIDEKSIDFEQQ